ncbi:DUF4344 domain-containing metallopeptidase [Jannaschia marina]|uniref:DUF4344 domain-containing metallopeptidase n=1 Tax=Jannaschia marina TaxID=2741674 RepID=UPI0015C70180|nr:DUF4344 domain-containing metallopeptidase [Jannaschia marina]
MIRRFALVLSLTILAPALAQADFVRNNLRFTLYHELGHAVIDQLSLPVFGPQENAADTFGLYLAHRIHSEAEMAEIITDMTALARAEALTEFFDPWDEYMPGAQRLARAICFYYGLAPEARLETARVLGMPSASKRDCADDAEVTARAWAAVFERMVPGPESAGAIVPAREGKALRVLAPDIARVNGVMALPRPVPVVQTTCGEDNAFYFEVDERIEFCREMVDALRARSGR